MKKAKKILAVFLVTAALATSLISIPASAASLANSFYSDTSLNYVRTHLLGGYWTKSCWAGTKGYSGYHYVRAYVGGTSSDPTNAWADTGRRYSYGDIEAKCTTPEVFVDNNSFPQLSFPTGYGKYGTT